MRRLPILLSCLFVGALLMPGCGDEEAPADTYRGPSGGYGTNMQRGRRAVYPMDLDPEERSCQPVVVQVCGAKGGCDLPT